jgi:hypothetical protein
MRRVLAIAVVALTAACAPAAFAHHSLAQYIQTRAEVLVGKVKDFQWTNPHTELIIEVTEGDKTVEWTFEGVSTSRLASAGFRKDTMMPGDLVSVVYTPRRDGKTGGMFIAVTLSDGKTLKLNRYQQVRGGGTTYE